MGQEREGEEPRSRHEERWGEAGVSRGVPTILKHQPWPQKDNILRCEDIRWTSDKGLATPCRTEFNLPLGGNV